MRGHTFKLCVAAILVAIGLTGCGDDDGDGGGGGTTNGGGGDAAATVTIVDFEFDPSELTVSSGDVIAVTNEGDNRHTFTSDDAGFDLELEAGDSGDATVATSEPGTYPFQCTIHPNMTGTITVE